MDRTHDSSLACRALLRIRRAETFRIASLAPPDPVSTVHFTSQRTNTVRTAVHLYLCYEYDE